MSFQIFSFWKLGRSSMKGRNMQTRFLSWLQTVPECNPWASFTNWFFSWNYCYGLKYRSSFWNSFSVVAVNCGYFTMELRISKLVPPLQWVILKMKRAWKQTFWPWLAGNWFFVCRKGSAPAGHCEKWSSLESDFFLTLSDCKKEISFYLQIFLVTRHIN